MSRALGIALGAAFGTGYFPTGTPSKPVVLKCECDHPPAKHGWYGCRKFRCKCLATDYECEWTRHD